MGTTRETLNKGLGLYAEQGLIRWDKGHRWDKGLLELMQITEEVNQAFVVVGTWTQLEHEMGTTAIRFVRQGAGYG